MQLYLLRLAEAPGQPQACAFGECAVFSDGLTIVRWVNASDAQQLGNISIYPCLEAAMLAQTNAILWERADYQ